MTIAKEVLEGQCRSCDYKVEIPITEQQIQKLNSGTRIQGVLPNVSPGDRELFISGICGDCFDKMFD